jgi:hypothetical protein
VIALPVTVVLLTASLAPVLADEDPDTVRKGLIDDAGPIAMLFVVLLGVAVYFLWRSLSKQMKRIDPNLPSGRDDREQAMDRQLTQEAVERGQVADPGADEPGPA